MIQTPILSTAKGQTQNETVNLEKTLNSTCLVKLTASFSVNRRLVLTSSNSSPPSISSITIRTLGLRKANKNHNNQSQIIIPFSLHLFKIDSICHFLFVLLEKQNLMYTTILWFNTFYHWSQQFKEVYPTVKFFSWFNDIEPFRPMNILFSFSFLSHKYTSARTSLKT